MGTAIKIDGLTKTFRMLMHKDPVKAVDDLSLDASVPDLQDERGGEGLRA